MKEDNFDVIIIGSGPAGLQAAIHAARRQVSVLVLGSVQRSSAFAAHIENYCCIDGEAGEHMLQQAREKAEVSGALFLKEDVMSLSRMNGWYSVEVESGRSLRAHALILAMGISRNTLGIASEKRLKGRGPSFIFFGPRPPSPSDAFADIQPIDWPVPDPNRFASAFWSLSGLRDVPAQDSS